MNQKCSEKHMEIDFQIKGLDLHQTCTTMNFQNGRKENETMCIRSPISTVARVGSTLHKLRGGRLMLTK